MTLLWRVPVLLMGGEALELDRTFSLQLLLPYAFLIGLIAYLGRKVFFANRANRMALYRLIFLFSVAIFQRILVYFAQTDPNVAMANELLLYAVAATLIGFSIERRLMFSAIPLAIGYVLATLQPQWTLDIFGIAAGGGLILMSLIWFLPQKVPT